MARQPRQFRAKNLSVSLAPTGRLAELTDKFRICVLNTNVCLGWTNCRLVTHDCRGWISRCYFFTCRGATLNCDRPYSWVACQAGTFTDPGCGPGSIYANPGDILVDPEIYVRQVAELKADLQEAIKQLDQHEKEIAEVAAEVGKTRG